MVESRWFCMAETMHIKGVCHFMIRRGHCMISWLKGYRCDL